MTHFRSQLLNKFNKTNSTSDQFRFQFQKKNLKFKIKTKQTHTWSLRLNLRIYWKPRISSCSFRFHCSSISQQIWNPMAVRERDLNLFSSVILSLYCVFFLSWTTLRNRRRRGREMGGLFCIYTPEFSFILILSYLFEI